MALHGQECTSWLFSNADASRSGSLEQRVKGSSTKELITKALGSFLARIAIFLIITTAPLQGDLEKLSSQPTSFWAIETTIRQ